MATWAETLDAYEASLVQHSLLLTGADPEPTTWDTLERPTGPIPAELADRARELHRRGEALAEQMGERLRDRPSRRMERPRTDRRAPSTLDISA